MGDDQSCNSFACCPCLDGQVHEVVVGALVRGGQVLLVHRRPDKHANPEVWDLPGGLVEAGESELDTLARELPPPPHLLARDALVEAMHDLRD